jgi:hypothetical protein
MVEKAAQLPRRVRVDARLETLDGPLGLVAVFTAALAAFAIQSLGWPLLTGRDWQDYLVYWHEVWHPRPLFPALMTARTPLTSFFFGPLFDLGGARAAEIGAGVLFAITVATWTVAARTFGRTTAIAIAALLVVFPTFGGLFHLLGSDSVFACVLSLVGALSIRAAMDPSTRRFALVGVGVAALVLARPAGLPFVLLAVLPLGLAAPWRRRALWMTAVSFSTVTLLGSWAAYNAVRFDDFTIARGGQAGIPLYRSLVVDQIVEPENGPATRELVAELDRTLVHEEPYRSWGFDTEDLLHSKSTWVFDDIVRIADQRWGWQDDYGKLFAVGLEAVESHPASYFKGVARTTAAFLVSPLVEPKPVSTWVGDPPPGDPRMTGYATPLVNNWALGPSGRFTVEGGLDAVPGVVVSPYEKRWLDWKDPSDDRRYRALRRNTIDALRDLTDDRRSRTVHSVLRALSPTLPPLAFWMFLGVYGTVRRRSAGLWPVTLLAVVSFAVIVETSAGFGYARTYAVPFLPVFILFAAAALLGHRRQA